MVRRGLWLTPAVALVAPRAVGGPEGFLSAVVGLAFTMVNLWLAGRISEAWRRTVRISWWSGVLGSCSPPGWDS